MSLNQPEIRRITLRLIFWLPLLFLLTWFWGRDYAELCLPLHRWVLGVVLPHFSVVYLKVGYTYELVFQTQVLATDLIEVYDKTLPSGFIVDASTPMYIVLIHPVVLGATALAWPSLSLRDRLLRLLACVPGLFLLEILDAPLVLASAINDLLSYGVDPAADQASLLVDWVHVMDGGGRFAMSLAVAVLTACTVRRRAQPITN